MSGLNNKSTIKHPRFELFGLDTVKLRNPEIMKTVAATLKASKKKEKADAAEKRKQFTKKTQPAKKRKAIVEEEEDEDDTEDDDDEDVDEDILEEKKMGGLTAKMLRLVKIIPLSSMTMIDNYGNPTIFGHVEEILEVYTSNMLSHYEMLKQHRVKSILAELEKLTERRNLIRAIVDKKLIVFEVSEETIRVNIEKLRLSHEAFDGLKIKDATLEKIAGLETKIHELLIEVENVKRLPSWKIWEARLLAVRGAMKENLQI